MGLDSRAAYFTAVYTVQKVLNNLLVTPPVDIGNLKGDLAESWEFSGDGLTLTFRLRRDVRWEDGRPFTSKDVSFSLDKYLNPASATVSTVKAKLPAIDTFSALDEYTFKITLRRRSASLLAVLAAPPVLIYPSHVPFTDQTWTDKPVGTGPFRAQSFAPDVHRYVRSDTYWKKDPSGRSLPYLDGIEMFVIADRALGQAAFETGRLDLLGLAASDLPGSQLAPLQKRMPVLRTFLMRSSFPILIQFSSRPPFDNQKVRQAIHIGIDRRTINDAGLEGTGYYPPSILVPTGGGGQWALPDEEVLRTPGFREPKEQDRALAKQLLKEAGVDLTGVTLNVMLQVNSSPYTEVATVLVSELAQLGVKSSVLPADLNAVRAGNFDIYNLVLGVSIDDPGEGLLEGIGTGRGSNFGKWSFPEIDDLLARQEAELDVAKRKPLLQELQRKLYDLAVLVPFVYAGQGIAAYPYVEGFAIRRTLNQSSAFRFEETWINR